MKQTSNASAPEAKPPRRRFFAALIAAVAGAGLARGVRRAEAAPQASQPFVGEIMLFAGNFAPAGWMRCDGSLLPISENETLFSLIGTMYGGDGQDTFALPDLRGRIPIHFGTGGGLSSRIIGETGGAEQTFLSAAAMPAHSHFAAADAGAGTSADPTGRLPARDAAGTLAWGSAAPVAMAAGHLGAAGSGTPHGNMMPYLTLNYCIALYGVYPSQ